MDSDYAAVYAGMADGELLALAAESDELAEEARKALWTELKRRGLEQQAHTAYRQRPAKGRGQLGRPPQFVTVAFFNNLLKAHLARTRLQSEGIQCFLADEHIVRMNWFWSFFVGRIKLQVKAADLSSAIDALTGNRTDLSMLEEYAIDSSRVDFRWMTLKTFVWCWLLVAALEWLIAAILSLTPQLGSG